MPIGCSLPAFRECERLLSSERNLFTVEGLAHEFGFRHIARFARYDRDLFGESRPQTLNHGNDLASHFNRFNPLGLLGVRGRVVD